MGLIKLNLEEGTGRIISYKPVEEDGEQCVPDEYSSIIDDAKNNNFEIYLKNGELVKIRKDEPQFENNLDSIEREIKNESKNMLAEFINNKSLQSTIDMNSIMERRRQKIFELKREQQITIEVLKNRINRLLDETKFKYYCSICLIIRDESEYLEEWLHWHISLGVEHFYIYDHNSKQPVSDFISKLDSSIQDKVTVIPFGGSHVFAQHDAYNNCLEKYRYESRWIGFIDSDEMVNIKTGKTMPDFLYQYERYAGLFISWIEYGANGHREKSSAPLRERFTKPAPKTDAGSLGKVFVQPLLMKKMLTHNGFPMEGYIVVDEHKNPVEEAESWKSVTTTDFICVDHYYTKSYQEWLEKLQRGSCDPDYFRKYEDFFKYNPDMEYCREEIYPKQEYEISKKQIRR